MRVLTKAPFLGRPFLLSARRQLHEHRPPRLEHSTRQAKPDAAPQPSNFPTLIYPDPPSSEHRNLHSFLEYADRISLSKGSTVYVGTHYEYVVATALSKLGFYLQRIGRAGDCGIDLLGTWTVPSAPTPLRTLVQCKATLKASPSWIRELEGAFAGAPPGWRGPDVLGLLVTDKPATPGIRKALGNSSWPMGYISCTRMGQAQQILWNQAAEDCGLRGLGISKRYNLPRGQEELSHKILLTWKGTQVPLIE